MGRWLKSTAVLLILLALLVSSAGDAADLDSLQEVIQLNELRLKQPAVVPIRPIVLIASIKGRQKRLSREFTLELVRTKLSQLGFKSLSYVGDFQSDLRMQKLHEGTLLSPKLVIEIDSQGDDGRSGYVSSCSLSLFEYLPNNDERTRFKAKRVWLREQDFKGGSQEELEGNVIQFVQKELETLKFASREKRAAKREAEGSGTGTAGKSSGTSMSYSLSWHDPDNKRNRFLFGVSAGTPAIGNLHLGFWGSRSFPVVIGLSGMYFDMAHRGVQLDVGWAFDNTGSVKQVAGIGVVGLNETSKIVSYDRDDLGRITGTSTEVVNGIRPYVGPMYTLDWNNFRLQAGVGVKAQDRNQSQVRALIQIGYTPPIGF